MSVKQELFESVRAVVSGRLRDEAQVRDLAHRVSEESVALRRRVSRAVQYARDGLRLEACAEAEAEPSVFDLAAAFDTDEMRQWNTLCERNKLPRPEWVSPDSLSEIEEAIAFTAPLRSRLALMRRLVLSDASAWHRLETLRELVSRDPDNPAWQEDLAALEPVAADELGEQLERDLARGKLEDAEACVQRLEDGRWHWSGAGKLAARLRTQLDRAVAARAVEEAAQVVQRLESEWGAENELGARTELESWHAVLHRLASCGGEAPEDLVARVSEVEQWLDGRREHENARREHQDRVAELDRLAQDEQSTLPQLRAALRAAEQTIEGVPDEVRGPVEARIATLERGVRVRRLMAFAGVVVLLAAVSGAAWFFVRSSAEEQRILELVQSIESAMGAGNLQEAEGRLAAADPSDRAHPSMQAAAEKVGAARSTVEQRARRFRELMTEARDPASDASRPDRVEAAREFADDEARQLEISQWMAQHARHVDAVRTQRVRAGMDAVAEVRRRIGSVTLDGSPASDGAIAKWETDLGDIERGNRDLPEVMSAVQSARTLVTEQRERVQAARAEAARLGQRAGLAAAAGDPARLAAALSTYAKQHRGTAEASGFEEAVAAAPAWDAVLAWGAVAPAAGTRLARAKESDRQAAVAAIDAYRTAHPASPFDAQAAALRALLVPAPQWRTWIEDKTTELEPLRWFMIERKDGSRWYCRKDPTRDPWQPKVGRQVKSVMVVVGRGADQFKERFEEFDQAAVRQEGPSPQSALATRLREIAADEERTSNDVESALAALEAIRGADAVDGALAATLAQGLIESFMPQAPEVLRPRLEAAARRLAKERPADIDWYDPGATGARERSRAARVALREAVQPEQWRKAYGSAVAAAGAPFAVGYAAAGIVLRDAAGETMFAAGPGGAPPAGTELFAVEPAVGGAAARLFRVGTTGTGGTAAFEPGVQAIAPGSMLFMKRPARSGGPR